jgi:hypothetical protein
MSSTQKQHRDQQRRFLHSRGWRAVAALKKNGAFKNAWIHPTQKGSYSREDAVSLTYRKHRLIVKAR